MTPAAAIAAALAERIETLVSDLLPAGHRDRCEWVCGDVMGAAPRRRGSLRVALDGPHRGQWRDWATGEHGDALDLVAAALGLDVAGAMAWARTWLGGDAMAPKQTRPPRDADHPDRDTDQRSEAACRMWREAEPVAGTFAEIYLRSRGLNGVAPVSLRFLSAARHPTGGRWPCMIAAISHWPGRRLVAVQRTFVDRDGAGKAPVSPARLSLGPTAGGAVRLAPLRPGAALVLAEGIEDGLVILAATDLPVWAALGTSGLRAVAVPPPEIAAEIVIAADADAPGEAAAKALSQRLVRDGHRVRIARPPAGRKDFGAVTEREARRAA